MIYVARLTCAAMLLPLTVAADELPGLDEPLKQSYVLKGDVTGTFAQTGKSAAGYSVICNMGQAIPNKKQGEDWYENRPIAGLTLELRAKLLQQTDPANLKPAGFVVLVKNGEVLKTFRPIGEMKGDVWVGDSFSSWGPDTTIEVSNGGVGTDGFARINIIDGMGFYYNSRNEEPAYFLSSCHKIPKPNLPVYDWHFGPNAGTKTPATIQKK